jgi:hypothetical protein
MILPGETEAGTAETQPCRGRPRYASSRQLAQETRPCPGGASDNSPGASSAG